MKKMILATPFLLLIMFLLILFDVGFEYKDNIIINNKPNGHLYKILNKNEYILEYVSKDKNRIRILLIDPTNKEIFVPEKILIKFGKISFYEKDKNKLGYSLLDGIEFSVNNKIEWNEKIIRIFDYNENELIDKIEILLSPNSR